MLCTEAYQYTDWDMMLSRMMMRKDQPIRDFKTWGASGARGDGYSQTYFSGNDMANLIINKGNTSAPVLAGLAYALNYIYVIKKKRFCTGGMWKMEEKAMKKQVYNPYLPSFEYVPDGEPHVFANRIYLYGSHDRFRGAGFCLNDYVCYSADVKDLTQWRYEGVIYRKEQDPRNQDIPADAPEQKLLFGILPEAPEDLNPRGIHAMWAPDVAKGLDGRYYLYYCLDFLPEIGVAVCDSPAGKYEFLGLVKHGDGVPLGAREGDLEQFDPGIFINDDGTIYLYSGNAPMKKENDYGRQGSQVMRLMPDMLTLAEEPRKLLPDVLDSGGTGYEGHEFFEASSIRKNNGKYYFVYSSVQSHELCYAVSDRPDGSIAQAEVTSCGLNNEPLIGIGMYPANICCHLTARNGAVFSHPERMKMNYPYLTQDIPDVEPTDELMERERTEPVQYVKNIQDGSTVGFKYFFLSGSEKYFCTGKR